MNSKIILAKNINMDRDYVNVLSYSESDMLELIRSQNKFVGEKDDFSFIRVNNSIMTNFTYSEVLQSNYIAFQNPDYSNKWFFAWIDDVIYKGESNTEITYTIDAWSTWFDYWNRKTCFINRQHVLDDTIGLHTIPEGLDIGEVTQIEEMIDDKYNRYSENSANSGFYVVLQTSWVIKDSSLGTEITEANRGTQFSGISVYNGTVFGTELILFKINDLGDFPNVQNYITRTNIDKHIADIENMFIVPSCLIDTNNLTSHTAYLLRNDLPFTFYTLGYRTIPTRFDTEIEKPYEFNGFTPKNNKCFVYPYNYLFVSNNNGSNNIYKYEDFASENCVFENELSMSIGVSGRIVPLAYKGMIKNEDESLALGKFPTCAWSADAFTNWLTTNSVNIVTGLIGSGLESKQSGKIDSVAGNIAGLIGDFYTASLLPNIQGGQATGDVVFSANINNFTFRKMRVKNEYMKIIDDYFSRFGYAIKSLDVPNLTGRRYWNYVEIGASEEIGYGSVPSQFMSTINNACRRGVTIWHNHGNLGNYSLNNVIES